MRQHQVVSCHPVNRFFFFFFVFQLCSVICSFIDSCWRRSGCVCVCRNMMIKHRCASIFHFRNVCEFKCYQINVYMKCVRLLLSVLKGRLKMTIRFTQSFGLIIPLKRLYTSFQRHLAQKPTNESMTSRIPFNSKPTHTENHQYFLSTLSLSDLS